MRPVKILFLISNAQLSGAENQLLLLSNNMDKSKYDIEICCLESKGPFTKAAKKMKLTVHIIDRKTRFDFYRLFGLVKLIKKKKYNIVSSYTWSANQYARLAKLFVKFKLISGERGRSLDKMNLENFIDKLLFPLSDMVIFNSKVQRDKFLSFTKVMPNNIKFIPNCINVDIFNNEGGNTLKKLIGLDNDVILIGTVGNFSVPKNFDMFIDLCLSLKDVQNNVHFIAIGSGPRKKYYEKIIKNKKLESHISLIGRREDLNKILCELDIFILTSSQEGMPNVILEAIASKVIVLSTKVDGCKELINNDINGFLVEPNDINEMLRKINFIINNKIEIENMIEIAYKDISKKYSLDNMINKYDYYFKEVMNG